MDLGRAAIRMGGRPQCRHTGKVDSLRRRGPDLEHSIGMCCLLLSRGERIDWLRGFHKLPWRNEAVSLRQHKHHVGRVCL